MRQFSISVASAYIGTWGSGGNFILVFKPTNSACAALKCSAIRRYCLRFCLAQPKFVCFKNLRPLFAARQNYPRFPAPRSEIAKNKKIKLKAAHKSRFYSLFFAFAQTEKNYIISFFVFCGLRQYPPF
ncbi:MAG: hypothetical protein IJ995_03790 [Clostridia bacterium]|nr:hypothetical protein [Clostridia bacterium]